MKSLTIINLHRKQFWKDLQEEEKPQVKMRIMRVEAREIGGKRVQVKVLEPAPMPRHRGESFNRFVHDVTHDPCGFVGMVVPYR